MRVYRFLFICIVFIRIISSSFSCECTSSESTGSLSPLQKNISIVVSFSMLHDWVIQLIKGIPERQIKITTLVPLKSDPHTYQSTPADSKVIAQSDMIFTIGLTFDTWVDGLVRASGTKGEHCIVSKNLTHIRQLPAIDPHVWHDIRQVKQMIASIADVLCMHLPAHAATIRRNQVNYTAELDALDQWIDAQFKNIPVHKRHVITTHDAFAYYGERYQVRFSAPIGLSTENEPDPKTMATLIRFIQQHGIRALFFENLTSPTVIQQIAAETGVIIDPKSILYADALAVPGHMADHYIGLMQHNTRMIVDAL